MIDPTTQGPATTVRASNAPVVLRIILAIVLSIPGLIGLSVYAWMVYEWSDQGFAFKSGDLWIMPLFIIAALGLVSFSVLTIGIVLRYARWRRAPEASLFLSVFSAVILVLGYQLALDCFAIDDTEDRQLSLLLSILGLAITAAPSFLHWWNAKTIAAIR
jgi:hypothetical protein